MGIFRLMSAIDVYLVRRFGVVNARRLGRLLVGVIPTIATFAFVGHCIILLCGGESHVAAFLFKYSFLWFVLLSVLSIAFEFCWVHRSFLLYNYIIGVCIEHQQLYGFGEWLTFARWAALLIGSFLVAAFVKNNCWRDFFEHTKHYK